MTFETSKELGYTYITDINYDPENPLIINKKALEYLKKGCVFGQTHLLKDTDEYVGVYQPFK